jgi:hypothetical protein
MEAYLPYVIQAVGGAIGGNILGALTRGGGGVVGRTIIGAIGGVGLAYAAGHFPGTVDQVTHFWNGLAGNGTDTSEKISDAITGGVGGGILGLIGGLLIRPRG